jgi:hypothetical protein
MARVRAFSRRHQEHHAACGELHGHSAWQAKQTDMAVECVRSGGVSCHLEASTAWLW